MEIQFIKQPKWTEIQNIVFQSSPNHIISGCAGSGKTLLACHIAMRHSKDKKVTILVFIKSLRTFIRDYIDSFGENNIAVLYEYEWRQRDFPKYDLIIVDEFQDFSLNDISNVISCASQGVYLFGDIEQKLYSKNFQKETTLSFDELIAKTNFEHIELKDNFRISEENKNLIASLYKGNSLRNSNFSTGAKPKILHFEDANNELNWLKEFLLSNTEFKNIGILIKQNDGFKGGYSYRRQLRIDKIYGIMELQEFFKENGIDSSYKYKSNDNLDFSKEININIMTYHSSKGLQFDCVILPFANFVNDNIGTVNLPYVGLTRASKQIIITYSGLVAEEYSAPVAASTFEGKILRKTANDDITQQQQLEMMMIASLKDVPGFEHLKKKSQQLDISDCKVIKL
jgi:ATP-dependent exoDNAse (exonuclease V) beta subunit